MNWIQYVQTVYLIFKCNLLYHSRTSPKTHKKTHFNFPQSCWTNLTYKEKRSFWKNNLAVRNNSYSSNYWTFWTFNFKIIRSINRKNMCIFSINYNMNSSRLFIKWTNECICNCIQIIFNHKIMNCITAD